MFYCFCRWHRQTKTRRLSQHSSQRPFKVGARPRSCVPTVVLKMARWLPFNVKSESSSAHLYGRSTANQRIEALWSIVKPSVITDWSEFFTSLVASTTISEGDEVHSAVLRFCFMDLIRHTLVEFKTYWNTHNVVKSSSSPGGIPDLLFYSTNSLMKKPADPSSRTMLKMCTNVQQ